MIQASIMSSAALFGHPSLARPSLCALSALGGHNTTPRCVARLLVLGAPASIMGSELSVYLTPALRFAPSRCPKTSLSRARVTAYRKSLFLGAAPLCTRPQVAGRRQLGPIGTGRLSELRLIRIPRSSQQT